MALLYNRIPQLTVERELTLGPNAFINMTAGQTLKESASISSPILAGKNLVMDLAGAARTYTLPRATGTGRKYKFYVGTVNTAGYIIKSSVGLDVMKGSVVLAGATPTAFTAASTSDTYTLNGTTSGGVSVGDWVEFTDLKPNVWAVTGVATFSGTAVTPFSDTVA